MKKILFATVAAVLVFQSIASAGASGPQGTDAAKVSVSIKELAFNATGNTDGGGNDGGADSRASASAVSIAGSDGGDGGATAVSADGGGAAASGAAGVYITTSDDTCMGSSGVGGQGDAFGFSVGSAWTDSNCIMLKNARELKAQGHHKAAKARLCMDEDNAMAFELAGEPCPRQLASTQAALAKIRAADPDYAAAAEPGVQFAALGSASADAGAPDEAPRTGTLLALAQSLAQSVAAVFASTTPSADLATPYPFDGIE